MVFNLQLSLVPQDSQVTCNLSWQGSIPQGVLEYIILYYRQGTQHVLSMSNETGSVVVSGLTNDEVYNFSAMAYRGSYTSGQMLSETAVQQCIPDAVPVAPQNLVGTVSTSGSLLPHAVQLNWTVSASSLNYPVTMYKIYQDGIVVATSQTNSCYIDGLVNGQSYAFKVKAVNTIGDSAFSSTINKTPVSKPDQVQGVIVHYDTDVSTDQVDLQWTAPNNNGLAISSYTIQYSLDPSFGDGVLIPIYTVVKNDASGSIIDARLTISPPDLSTSTGWYYFQVRATNSLGSGYFSPVATITPAVEPIAVQNLAWSNRDGNGDLAMGTVTLTWNYGVDNACPLLGYLIAYLDENNALKNIYAYQTGVSASYTVDGLQNGYTYTMSVIPLNTLGTGIVADIDVIPSYLPDPIYDVDITQSSHSITLNWSVPYDQGDVLLGYKIYRSLDNVDYSLLHTINDPTITTYFNSGLTNGTTYYYYVTSFNANSESDPSNYVNEYPNAVPSAVSGITCGPYNTTADGHQIQVSFSQDSSSLSDNGGSQILYWQIAWDDGANSDSHNISAGIATNMSYVITGIRNAFTCNIDVCAVNRSGPSGTTRGSAVAHGCPDAVANIAVTNSNANATGEQLTVSWDLLNATSLGVNVSPSDEGQSIASYDVLQDGVIIATKSASATSHVVNNLINGKYYAFHVMANNADGTSLSYTSINIRPSGRPDVPSGFGADHYDQRIGLHWNILNGALGGSNVHPSNEGANASYKLYKNGTFLNSINPTQNTYNVSSLYNGVQQSFYLNALNANGETDNVAQGYNTITAIPSTSPASATSVNVYSFDSGLEIAWQNPADINVLENDGSAGVRPSGGLVYT